MRPASLTAALEARGAQFDSADAPATVLHFGDPAVEIERAHQDGGVLDASSRAVVWLRGKDRAELINRLTTNDINLVTDELGVAAVLPTAKGRILDHVSVFRPDADTLGLIGSERRADELVKWLQKYIIMEECDVSSGAGETTVLQAFGPKAAAVLESALGAAPPTAGNGLGARTLDLDGQRVTVIQSTSVPGESGYDLVVAADAAASLFDKLANAGLHPTGDTAFEALRIESGRPRSGRELTEEFNPLEAGLIGSVSFTKGCYIGQEVVARLQNYKKVKRSIVGVRFAPGTPADQLGDLYVNNFRVGSITSATDSARLGATVGLAMVKSDYQKMDGDIDAVIDGEPITGKMVELPFSG